MTRTLLIIALLFIVEHSLACEPHGPRYDISSIDTTASDATWERIQASGAGTLVPPLAVEAINPAD